MPHPHTAPLVSVLMPAYNHASYVGEAVGSVLGQTYGNLELIAIDDASSDATWSVLQSFGDERLRRFRHDINLGAHATLNEALSRARGTLVAVINSDDVYAPERLQKAVACLAANPELGACFSRYGFIDEAGRTVREADSLAAEFPDAAQSLGGDAAKLERNELQVLSVLARNYLHTTSNLVCRREAVEQVGPFRNFRYVHDHEFFLRLCLRHPIAVLPENLLGYRVHAANTLAEHAAASVAETAAMLSEFLLTHALQAMRRNHPAFPAVLAYLLEGFRTYGADRLMLLLVLAEAGGSRAADPAHPMFLDCAHDDAVLGRVEALLRRDRAAEDLVWQESQTTKWWQTAQARGGQLARMKARQDRVGKKLWDARQSLWEAQRSLHETRDALSAAEQQLAWWREKYWRTLAARIRKVARRVIDATFASRNRDR